MHKKARVSHPSRTTFRALEGKTVSTNVVHSSKSQHFKNALMFNALIKKCMISRSPSAAGSVCLRWLYFARAPQTQKCCSCDPLLTTFASTDQWKTLSYVSLFSHHVCCALGSFTLNWNPTALYLWDIRVHFYKPEKSLLNYISDLSNDKITKRQW